MSLCLENITLFQFKNHSSCSFDTGAKAVAFVGKNGQGKTNILEAIYYLCFTKSFTHLKDNANVMWGKEGFRIEGRFIRNTERHSIKIVQPADGKKNLTHNDRLVQKYTDYIGLFPAVLIAPDNRELIYGLSAVRRKYMDAILAQINNQYLQHLLTYNKILVQKNGLLKYWKQHPNEDLLQIYNAQLHPLAVFIYEARKEILPTLWPILQNFYSGIACKNEALSLHYETQLESYSWDRLVQMYTEKEKIMQRTLFGVHKDDIVFCMEEKPFKNTASQGQKKTLLFALKLAEYYILQQKKQINPLLLLDDVFEKLDMSRLENLLKIMLDLPDVQLFITDVQKERVLSHIRPFVADYTIYEL